MGPAPLSEAGLREIVRRKCDGLLMDSEAVSRTLRAVEEFTRLLFEKYGEIAQREKEFK